MALQKAPRLMTPAVFAAFENDWTTFSQRSTEENIPFGYIFPNYAVDQFKSIGDDLYNQSKNVRRSGNVVISAPNLYFLKHLIRVIENNSNTVYNSSTKREIDTKVLLLIIERITHLQPSLQTVATMIIAKCIDVFSNFEKCIKINLVKKTDEQKLTYSLQALDNEFNNWILRILTKPSLSITKERILQDIVAKLSVIFPDAKSVFDTCKAEQVVPNQTGEVVLARNRSSRSSSRQSPLSEITAISSSTPTLVYVCKNISLYTDVRNRLFFLCDQFHIKLKYGLNLSINSILTLSDLICNNKFPISSTIEFIKFLDDSKSFNYEYIISLIQFICKWKEYSLLPPFIPLIKFIETNIKYVRSKKPKTQLEQSKVKEQVVLAAQNINASVEKNNTQQKQAVKGRKGKRTLQQRIEELQRNREEKANGEGKAEGAAEGADEGKEGKEDKKEDDKEAPTTKSSFGSKSRDWLAKMGISMEKDALANMYDIVVTTCADYGITNPADVSIILASLLGIYQSFQVDNIEQFKTRVRRYIREDMLGERMPGKTPQENVIEKLWKLKPRINRLNFFGSLIMIGNIVIFNKFRILYLSLTTDEIEEKSQKDTPEVMHIVENIVETVEEEYQPQNIEGESDEDY